MHSWAYMLCIDLAASDGTAIPSILLAVTFVVLTKCIIDSKYLIVASLNTRQLPVLLAAVYGGDD